VVFVFRFPYQRKYSRISANHLLSVHSFHQKKDRRVSQLQATLNQDAPAVRIPCHHFAVRLPRRKNPSAASSIIAVMVSASEKYTYSNCSSHDSKCRNVLPYPSVALFIAHAICKMATESNADVSFASACIFNRSPIKSVLNSCL